MRRDVRLSHMIVKRPTRREASSAWAIAVAFAIGAGLSFSLDQAVISSASAESRLTLPQLSLDSLSNLFPGQLIERMTEYCCESSSDDAADR